MYNYQGLPISKDTNCPNGFKLFLSSSPICRTNSPLAGAGNVAHCGHASCAFVIASFTSCVVDVRTFAIISPVVGEIDSIIYVTKLSLIKFMFFITVKN